MIEIYGDFNYWQYAQGKKTFTKLLLAEAVDSCLLLFLSIKHGHRASTYECAHFICASELTYIVSRATQIMLWSWSELLTVHTTK